MDENEAFSEQDRLMSHENNFRPHNLHEEMEKINNFKAITQTTSVDFAIDYLSKNNWNEAEAAKQYFEHIKSLNNEIAKRINLFNNQRHEHNLDHSNILTLHLWMHFIKLIDKK